MADMENELYASPNLPWLSTHGREGDVVLSSRVRLARNFERLPFPNRADRSQLAAVEKTVAAMLPVIEETDGQLFEFLKVDELTGLEQEVLCVKNLLSRSLVKRTECRGALISDDLSASILVNEDDHLHILCMAPGLELDQPLARAQRLDDAFAARIPMAFDEKLGYLTSWPSNLGTGLRASVIMHLPGLVFTENMDNIIRVSSQLGLNVRGLFTGGKEILGSLFRISNQLTLGFSETDLVSNLKSAILEIAVQERRARKALELHQSLRLEDNVWRAFGALRYARRMHSGDALDLMSKLWLGIEMKMVDTVKPDFFPELLVANREEYLKYIAGDENLPKEDLYRLRADIIRQALERHAIA